MRIGRLRHRVTIEEPVQTADGQGGYTTTWSTYAADVPAGLEPLKGTERFEAQKLNPKLSHKVILRYMAGITAAMRVTFGERRLYFGAPPVNREERNISLEILAWEETG